MSLPIFSAAMALYRWLLIKFARLKLASEKKEGEALPDYLSSRIFAGQTGTTIAPRQEDVEGFE